VDGSQREGIAEGGNSIPLPGKEPYPVTWEPDGKHRCNFILFFLSKIGYNPVKASVQHFQGLPILLLCKWQFKTLPNNPSLFMLSL
jgi:hypothetical protein